MDETVALKGERAKESAGSLPLLSGMKQLAHFFALGAVALVLFVLQVGRSRPVRQAVAETPPEGRMSA